MYTTSDCASPSWPCPWSTADTTTTPPEVECRSMWVRGSAPLSRRIRSLVKSAAMPDQKVSCCGRGGGDGGAQEAVHSASSSADRTRNDVMATDPLCSRTEPDYTGSQSAEPVMTIDDKCGR